MSLDNRQLHAKSTGLDALANRATALAAVPLETIFAKDPMVRVSRRLTDGTGALVSDNFYWRGGTLADYRALDGLPKVAITLAASEVAVAGGQERVVRVELANRSPTPALNVKLMLVNGSGVRILPAFYSDNDVTLLPGETRTIEVRYPASAREAHFELDGWNVAP
ncbi:glycoside hydrolase family 2 protein [Sphingomonas sp.]|uniref:glycoside hydrolase family 2 protein n=1 Tax=Sphingomonas sp. TaxID=28214 RepID=UPI0025F97436|nr:glycoside hydrolase family 2 protein [Sphingomonas sp.]